MISLGLGIGMVVAGVVIGAFVGAHWQWLLDSELITEMHEELRQWRSGLRQQVILEIYGKCKERK